MDFISLSIKIVPIFFKLILKVPHAERIVTSHLKKYFKQNVLSISKKIDNETDEDINFSLVNAITSDAFDGLIERTLDKNTALV